MTILFNIFFKFCFRINCSTPGRKEDEKTVTHFTNYNEKLSFEYLNPSVLVGGMVTINKSINKNEIVLTVEPIDFDEIMIKLLPLKFEQDMCKDCEKAMDKFQELVKDFAFLNILINDEWNELVKFNNNFMQLRGCIEIFLYLKGLNCGKQIKQELKNKYDQIEELYKNSIAAINDSIKHLLNYTFDYVKTQKIFKINDEKRFESHNFGCFICNEKLDELINEFQNFMETKRRELLKEEFFKTIDIKETEESQEKLIDAIHVKIVELAKECNERFRSISGKSFDELVRRQLEMKIKSLIDKVAMIKEENYLN